MTINTFYDEGGAMTKSRGLPQNHPRSIRTLLLGLRGYYRTEVHIALLIKILLTFLGQQSLSTTFRLQHQSSTSMTLHFIILSELFIFSILKLIFKLNR